MRGSLQRRQAATDEVDGGKPLERMRNQAAVTAMGLELIPAVIDQNLQRRGTQLPLSLQIAGVIIESCGTVIDLRIDDHHIVRLIRRNNNQRRGSDLRQRNRTITGHKGNAATQTLIQAREELLLLTSGDRDGRRAAHQETSLRLQRVLHRGDLYGVAILSQRPHTMPTHTARHDVLT